MSAANKQCSSCLGTGWWLLMKSWFLNDGLRKERCHVCKGSGKSTYRDDSKWIAWQREMHELAGRA